MGCPEWRTAGSQTLAVLGLLSFAFRQGRLLANSVSSDHTHPLYVIITVAAAV